MFHLAHKGVGTGGRVLESLSKDKPTVRPMLIPIEEARRVHIKATQIDLPGWFTPIDESKRRKLRREPSMGQRGGGRVRGV